MREAGTSHTHSAEHCKTYFNYNGVSVSIGGRCGNDVLTQPTHMFSLGSNPRPTEAKKKKIIKSEQHKLQKIPAVV